MGIITYLKDLIKTKETPTVSSSLYDIYEQQYLAYKYAFEISNTDYISCLIKHSRVYNTTVIGDTYPLTHINHWGERTLHIKTQLLLVVLHKLNIRPPL